MREVTVDELDAALQRGARVIDVRETHEYVNGHVPVARLIPMGSVPDEVEAFRGDDVYVICQAGGRSARVCEFLAGHGIDAVNVAGGTGAWIASGREVELGEPAA